MENHEDNDAWCWRWWEKRVEVVGGAVETRAEAKSWCRRDERPLGRSDRKKRSVFMAPLELLASLGGSLRQSTKILRQSVNVDRTEGEGEEKEKILLMNEEQAEEKGPEEEGRCPFR